MLTISNYKARRIPRRSFIFRSCIFSSCIFGPPSGTAQGPPPGLVTLTRNTYSDFYIKNKSALFIVVIIIYSPLGAININGNTRNIVQIRQLQQSDSDKLQNCHSASVTV